MIASSGLYKGTLKACSRLAGRSVLRDRRLLSLLGLDLLCEGARTLHVSLWSSSTAQDSCAGLEGTLKTLGQDSLGK